MRATVFCSVCRSNHCTTVAALHSEIDGTTYRAIVCRECGLVFAAPLSRFSLEQLQDIYGENYTEGQRMISAADNLAALREATAKQMQLVESYIRKGTALNVEAMGPAVRRIGAVLLGKNLSKRYGRPTPPEHLYVFSRRSLSELMQSAGFDVLRVFTPTWGDKAWFPFPSTKSLSFIERLFFFLDRIGAVFGSGEVLVVLARKR